jgi:hypothetical protein
MKTIELGFALGMAVATSFAIVTSLRLKNQPGRFMEFAWYVLNEPIPPDDPGDNNLIIGDN